MESVSDVLGRGACPFREMYRWDKTGADGKGVDAIDVFSPHTCTVLEDIPIL